MRVSVHKVAPAWLLGLNSKASGTHAKFSSFKVGRRFGRMLTFVGKGENSENSRIMGVKLLTPLLYTSYCLKKFEQMC